MWSIVITEILHVIVLTKTDEKACLTGRLVSVGAQSDVILLVALLGSRHFLHFADFRHAEFGVVVEERAAALNGEVVLGPVPQLAQVLVVQGVEGVETVGKRRKCKGRFQRRLSLSFFFPLEKQHEKREKKMRLTLSPDALP